MWSTSSVLYLLLANVGGIKPSLSQHHYLVNFIPWSCAGGPAGADDLPGTGGKRRPAVRSRAVALSPTGRCWAAATTEGLLLYSLDPGAMFDPTDLAEDVTPQACLAFTAMRRQVYGSI